MGTKVHCESYLPGYYSMRDLNADSNHSSWPLFHGDKNLTNGHCYDSFLLRTVTDAYPGYDKDALKQIMLEHEAIFKNQVYELHRLYRIQRDMMDEVKRREIHNHQIPIEAASSSIPFVSQMPSEDAQKWHFPSFPLANSISVTPHISGAEIVNSPLSCTKGNGIQAGPSPSGCNLKNCDILESRPSKVRKKLFDLQLPADEYIDTGEWEQSHNSKISKISSNVPNINHKIATQNGINLVLGGGVEIDCKEDSSKSGSCLKSSIGLADLNEPIQVEETTFPASVDFLGRAPCHEQVKGLDLSAKSKSQFLGLPKKVVQNPQHGNNNGTLNSICVDNKGNGRESLSHIYGTGHSKSNLNSVCQGLQPDKFPLTSLQMHTMPNKTHQPLGSFPTDPNRGDFWRERTVLGSEIPERNHLRDIKQPEPVVGSHSPSPYAFVNSSDLANGWSHSISNLGKPSSTLTQKLTSFQTHPSLNSSVTLCSSQPSAQSHEIFGNKWLLNSSSRSNHGFGCDLPDRNGFCHGSSSVTKEVASRIPSVGFDYPNCNKDDNVASERSLSNGSLSYFKSSNVVDLKFGQDMNLNMVLSRSLSNGVVSQHDGLGMVEGQRKHESHVAALPWLRAKTSCKNEVINMRDSKSVELTFFQASSNHWSNKIETDKSPNEIVTQSINSVSSNSDAKAKRNEVDDSQGSRKILGFPIFENSFTSKNDSSLISTSASLHCPWHEDIKKERRNGIIDINVACDVTVTESDKQIAAEVLVEEKGKDIKVSGFRNHIDLNTTMIEEEVLLAPSVSTISSNVKIAVQIDLEVPITPEAEEDFLPVEERNQHEIPLQSPQSNGENVQDEVVRIAAEAIVAISTSGHHCNIGDATCHPSEVSLADSLVWFVDIISSCANDIESKLCAESRGKDDGGNEGSSIDEIDSFEAMTLKLTEITEEEYMPKPLVPDNGEIEESGAASLANRSQRGPTRRGRQRRDFQRDILPGLTSLSRHEVTEDLQTFGGLMRATGHRWHLGLTRRNGTRNGGGRGRRRSLVDTAPTVAAGSTICTSLIQQLNNIEMGLEDRSLTGWGRTTRRPRRQRCPAGNPPPVPLC